MKKHLYLILIAFLPLLSFGQKTFIQGGKLNGILPVDENGYVMYQRVIQVEGIGKDELFKRARKWFSKSYSSPKDVIQIADPNTGEISGRGIFLVNESMMGITHDYPVNHTLSIEIKDGRYRATLNKFSVDDPRSPFALEKIPYASKKFLERFYGKVDANVNMIFESFNKAINTLDDF